MLPISSKPSRCRPGLVISTRISTSSASMLSVRLCGCNSYQRTSPASCSCRPLSHRRVLFRRRQLGRGGANAEEARDLAFSPDTADASELAYQAEEALDALREMRGTARCLVVCGATDRVEMVRLLRTEVEAFERAREAFGAVLAKVLGESGEGSGS